MTHQGRVLARAVLTGVALGILAVVAGVAANAALERKAQKALKAQSEQAAALNLLAEAVVGQVFNGVSDHFATQQVVRETKGDRLPVRRPVLDAASCGCDHDEPEARVAVR